MIIGFDFGTTNSLISFVEGEATINLFDSEGLPYPSVVRYEGQSVIAGREARLALEEVGLGVYGNTVRSPKVLLGNEVVSVGGVERSPRDIVADVIRHVRSEGEKNHLASGAGSLDRAVVTIPVTMNGPKRAALREAFARSGITIVQFVHEPLAALYGHLRTAPKRENLLRKLRNRYVLVVDWGGGTLDLTLCHLNDGRILQLRNGGSDQVGGDQFDEVILEEVVKRFSMKSGIVITDQPTKEARQKLRADTEKLKIELSQRPSATLYRGGYFPESGTNLEYELTRRELDEIIRPLITEGTRNIDTLLDSASISPAQVSMCLVAGGMAAMPSIRSQLHELFGPERVVIPSDSATLIAQGAAWIAHDKQTLQLAKDIELEMARGSRLAVLRAGMSMPTDGLIQREIVHLYCTDPSDGKAKFPIVATRDLKTKPQASDPRTSLGMLSVHVDKTAPPLVERLELELEIDEDLILKATAKSCQKADTDTASFYDLEFGVKLPGTEDLGPASIEDADSTPFSGGLMVRTNVADREDPDLIPGDVLYAHNPNAFSRRPGVGRATDEQLIEHLYYEPCALCRRPWGDPGCRCASGG